MPRKQDVTLDDFVDQFERPRIPVVLTGLTDGWPAAESWTEDQLLARFREHKFKASLCLTYCSLTSRTSSLCMLEQAFVSLGHTSGASCWHS